MVMRFIIISSRCRRAPHADAVFTAVAGQKVGVVTADCLPLLIASRDGRYVCSVHAGWQGLVSGIVDNSLACFRQQGVALADLVIAVGAAYSPLLLRSLRRILSATAGPARR
ncbi:membrane protein [Klebsiella pneumoniae]|uniref:Membrane protein n=1 Tax=Klebsiella pneumoniae TaxID=573 RepID=A0A2X3CIL0_KLEPN|nr:membrane protein [Klebsiella pneumoniae]